jgi:hypothetical protein
MLRYAILRYPTLSFARQAASLAQTAQPRACASRADHLSHSLRRHSRPGGASDPASPQRAAGKGGKGEGGTLRKQESKSRVNLFSSFTLSSFTLRAARVSDRVTTATLIA